jgi:hypothetical protein
MTIDRRVQQLERVEGEHFREAVAAFAAFWKARALDPQRQEYVRAYFQARGCDATRPDEQARWHAAQPPGYQTVYGAMEAAIFGMVLRPYDEAAIRAALARVAPHINGCAGDPPLTILTALRAALLGSRANVAAYRRARGRAQR